MSDWRFTRRVEARFRDCDPMGHVNNAVCLVVYDDANAVSVPVPDAVRACIEEFER